MSSALLLKIDLSPDTSLSDLPDAIPEHDEYRAMPNSLRHVLTPPNNHASIRPRSILLEPSSPYSRSRRSPSDSTQGRARQSVSSIGSCSTVQSPTAQVKTILTRHDSGISMATTKSTRRKKRRRSPPSVKFVDVPTVHYDDAVYRNVPPLSPPSLPSTASPRQQTHWFTRLWNRSSSPPPRPPISGPYHLSYAPSLVDYRSSTPSRQKPGRLKRLWNRLTSILS